MTRSEAALWIQQSKHGNTGVWKNALRICLLPNKESQLGSKTALVEITFQQELPEVCFWTVVLDVKESGVLFGNDDDMVSFVPWHCIRQITMYRLNEESNGQCSSESA